MVRKCKTKTAPRPDAKIKPTSKVGKTAKQSKVASKMKHMDSATRSTSLQSSEVSPNTHLAKKEVLPGVQSAGIFMQRSHPDWLQINLISRIICRTNKIAPSLTRRKKVRIPVLKM